MQTFSCFHTVSVHHKWDGPKLYHQKVNLRVVFQVAKQPKTWDLRTENTENPWNALILLRIPIWPGKRQNLKFELENHEKLALKHSTE